MKRLSSIAVISIAGLSFAGPGLAVARVRPRSVRHAAKAAKAAPKPTQTTVGFDLKAPSVKIRMVH